MVLRRCEHTSRSCTVYLCCFAERYLLIFYGTRITRTHGSSTRATSPPFQFPRGLDRRLDCRPRSCYRVSFGTMRECYSLLTRSNAQPTTTSRALNYIDPTPKEREFQLMRTSSDLAKRMLASLFKSFVAYVYSVRGVRLFACPW